ncbi:octaprenyl-diphosphate synthase [Rickettsia parkeri]|nr:octaprenyl-diphosphate synthase [Rickettsia parkeri]
MSPPRHYKRLKGAWQSQDFSTRLLRQNLQSFLAMTENKI